MATPGDSALAAAASTGHPAEYLEELIGAHRRAEAAAGECLRFYAVAGRVVALRFAGPALVLGLTRALAHLEIAPAPAADLTVRLWDSASTGTAMPPPAWGPTAYREHGVIEGFFDGHIHTMFQWGSNALSMLDAARGEAVYWIRSGQQLPYFERAAPLRTVFHLWLGARGVQLVHGAAVGTASGCALLVGRAGAGKSSTGLACLDAGLGHLADDYCLLEPGPPPVVHGLYSSAKFRPDALERLSRGRGMVDNPVRPEHEKALCFLHEHCPDQILARAPLAAVLIPRVTHRPETAIRPASAGAALAALAPSTILQLPGAGAGALHAMASAVRRVPCFHLDAGTDGRGLGDAVAALLAGGRAG